MGEIADDMIDGYSCSWCGIYFEDEHGYPVICKDCFHEWKLEYKDKSEEDLLKECGVQVAFIKELGGK